jgi:hypothetical protein
MKRVEVPYIYPYEDNLIKSTNTVYKIGEEAEGEWKYNIGVNLLKVHCTHVWNYHNQIPSYY